MRSLCLLVKSIPANNIRQSYWNHLIPARSCYAGWEVGLSTHKMHAVKSLAAILSSISEPWEYEGSQQASVADRRHKEPAGPWWPRVR